MLVTFCMEVVCSLHGLYCATKFFRWGKIQNSDLTAKARGYGATSWFYNENTSQTTRSSIFQNTLLAGCVSLNYSDLDLITATSDFERLPSKSHKSHTRDHIILYGLHEIIFWRLKESKIDQKNSLYQLSKVCIIKLWINLCTIQNTLERALVSNAKKKKTQTTIL